MNEERKNFIKWYWYENNGRAIFGDRSLTGDQLKNIEEVCYRSWMSSKIELLKEMMFKKRKENE